MRSPAFLTIALLLVGAACGDDANPGACEMGMTVPCTCRTGASGMRACESDGSFSACMCDPVDAGIDALSPDTTTTVTTCNPLAARGEQGCTGGQKCTWLQTQDSPDIRGELACVPDGVATLGASCTRTPTGDECAAGDICVDGTCKRICEVGSNAGCDAAARCAEYADIFVDLQGVTTHGVCEQGCDPITQQTYGGGSCPVNQACYPLISATTTIAVCAFVGTVTNGQAITPPVFANSCIPGHVPRRRPGTATQECAALCQVAEVTSTLNASLEGGVAPYTCAAKGAASPDNPTDGESCRFWYAREPFTNTTAFSNTLGWCVKHATYTYDSDGDQFPDAPLPRCPTVTHGDVIPPNGTGMPSDAVYFWCAPKPPAFASKPQPKPVTEPMISKLVERSL